MSDLVLTEAIRNAHKDSDENYGMPRVRTELREAGHRVSHKRCGTPDEEGRRQGSSGAAQGI